MVEREVAQQRLVQRLGVVYAAEGHLPHTVGTPTERRVITTSSSPSSPKLREGDYDIVDAEVSPALTVTMTGAEVTEAAPRP